MIKSNINSLFTRAYSDDDSYEEEVVVVGNRRDIEHNVPEIIECEFVYQKGILVDAHVVRFKRQGRKVLPQPIL